MDLKVHPICYKINMKEGVAMIILEKPYVSEFLIDTIVQHDWRVLDNKTIADAEI